jgi:general secretion pathway protein B
MSYILDALRKSEAERRQGKAPDLGQSVQIIHRPRKKPVSGVVWAVVAALLINAGVLAYVFWPERQAPEVSEASVAAQAPIAPVEPASAIEAGAMETPETVAQPEMPDESEALSAQEPLPEQAEAFEAPLVIVPSTPVVREPLTQPAPEGRVPHLVELPLSFQKSVPDLTFNSHIYASDPSASRVMINSQYLRPGDQLGQLRIERITEDGVIFSRDGQRFRVGTVRDWVSPR